MTASSSNIPPLASHATVMQRLDEANALRDRVRRAERLASVTTRLNALHDLDDLLPYILETACDVLDCEAASILLYDADAGKLRFAAATGDAADHLIGRPVPLEGSLAGHIFSTDRPVIVGDVAHDARHFDSVPASVSFDARSLVGVPMSSDARPIGVLEALNKREGLFNRGDIEALGVIAAQAAIAIRNVRQRQALEAANAELSRLDQLKSDFLSLASHELRTPLSLILGYGAILQEEVDEPIRECATLVLDAAQQMRDVVETMGHMEVLRSSSIALARRTLDLRSVLRDAADTVGGLLVNGKHTLSFDVPDLPVLVSADGDRLQLVFANLLKNACQYSPAGNPIELALTTASDIHVRIRDHGCGLAKDMLDVVFDEFFQVEDLLTREQGGLGLGLTVARELVRLHDGRIYAESDGLGHGTTFHVRLPLPR